MQHPWWRRPFLERRHKERKCIYLASSKHVYPVCLLTIITLGLFSELGHVDIVFTFLTKHKDVTLRSLCWISTRHVLTVDIFRLSRFCRENKKREKEERKGKKEMRAKTKKINSQTSELKAWIKSRSSLLIRHLCCFYHYSYRNDHNNTNTNHTIASNCPLLNTTHLCRWKTSCKLVVSCEI